MKRSFRAAVFTAALCGLTAGAAAERIVLKNGQTIFGSIRSETEERITINRHGSDLVLNRADIASIDHEDTAYYEELILRAFEQGDQDRITLVIASMERHAQPAIREKARELRGRYLTGQTDLAWGEGTDLDRLSIEELYSGFNSALDRIRWQEAVGYGREILRRDQPSVAFFGSLLEAYENTNQRTSYLATDAYRLYLHVQENQLRVPQVYLANALEERALALWDPERPSRSDTEIYVCLLVRGLVLTMNDLREAPEERRAAIDEMFADLVSLDDWDYAMRNVPGDYPLLVFAGASRTRPDLLPVMRYFAMLKEEEILGARTDDHILEDPLREARATYIYTISDITPLPKEKLWSSARDLALIGATEAPKVSSVMEQVFTYTPSKKHADLAMAYESILVPEGMRGDDRGEGLVHALRLIAKRRCGPDFDREITWEGLRSLATVRKETPDSRPGQTLISISDILSAAFTVTSEYEKEKVCFMYEERIVRSALAGEYGPALHDAARTLAWRRTSDVSEREVKWNSFRALATLHRVETGVPIQEYMPVSEVISGALSVAEEKDRVRLCLTFEEEIIAGAEDPREDAATLLPMIETVATARGEDLADADASWRAFRALAQIRALELTGQPQKLPSTEDTLGAAFDISPSWNHANISIVFSDAVHNAITIGNQRGESLRRAANLIAMQRIANHNDPLGAWRAIEVLLRHDREGKVDHEHVLERLTKLTEGSADQRIHALAVATAFYQNNPNDALLRRYKAQWLDSIGNSVSEYIAMSAKPQTPLPIEGAVPGVLLAGMPELRQMIQAQNNHRDLLRRIDRLEVELTERFDRGRAIVDAGTLPSLAQSLNEVWDATSSPAARARLMEMVEETFDESTRLALIEQGMRLGAPGV